MTIDELIEALERAERPRWELDAAIMRLLYPDTTHDQETDTWTMPFAGKPVRVRLACYTASIDAALTLVPDDWDTQLFSRGHGRWFCRLRREQPYALVAPFERVDGETTYRPTGAIALCIAALKARKGAA